MSSCRDVRLRRSAWRSGEELTFTHTDDGFVDDQTASRWNVLGQAIDGPPAGAALEPFIRVQEDAPDQIAAAMQG
ncbi:MAG TPA: hypothetical protein VFI46_17230, partial [Jiangellaceae bacterium]|nr:hypothetical protein [Jiangellaceae bacterium]